MSWHSFQYTYFKEFTHLRHSTTAGHFLLYHLLFQTSGWQQISSNTKATNNPWEPSLGSKITYWQLFPVSSLYVQYAVVHCHAQTNNPRLLFCIVHCNFFSVSDFEHCYPFSHHTLFYPWKKSSVFVNCGFHKSQIWQSIFGRTQHFLHSDTNNCSHLATGGQIN